MRIPFLQTLRNSFARRSPVFLYNTLGTEKQEFTLPAPAKTVRMYNCGPTVYDTQHIGNLSMFVFTDTLRKVLEYNNFKVKQVINITDVGHLTSDSDEGEDKMTKGLEREGLEPTLENMLNLGEKYTGIFLRDLDNLNIRTGDIIFPRASGYIRAQIAMIATLIEKGFAYSAPDGVYFDTSRSPAYGVLGGIHSENQAEGARIAANKNKRNNADFALWKFSARGGNIIGWDSPWGKGFPGWHIECSAMARAVLGEQIDIHTGGIEHIPVHHNNEIAQSESATGKRPFSRFWLHRAHLQIEGAKIAKSEGNTVYLSGIVERGFHPLALRYLFLTSHYRSTTNFSWKALEGAQTSYLKLRRAIDMEEAAPGTPPASYQKKMHEAWNDDLDTPKALSILWDMTKDRKLSSADIKAGILDADRVFGLGLNMPDSVASALYTKLFGKPVALEKTPEDIQLRIKERDEARLAKNWELADSIRDELDEKGYILEDSTEGTRISKR